MIKSEVQKEYIEWMHSQVCYGRFSKDVTYHDLFDFLYGIEFKYTIPIDENRASHGIDLRERFADEHDLNDISDMLTGPCNMLEMILALAIRLEELIMDDPSMGNRMPQWFWKMIVTLGLGGMRDGLFDEKKAKKSIERFLKREYSPDGRGGLFYIRNCKEDVRDVDIWTQALWYLDTIE